MSRAYASRYQPVLVALHWLVAVMIIGLLCLGFFVLADMPNTDPKKLNILVWHMSGGMFVLVLMIVRVIIRAWSARPAPGAAPLDRVAALVHRGLYAIVFLLIASGWLTGWVIQSAFQPHGSLPASFAALPTFRAHALLATLLALLVIGHTLAAFYHQLVLKDGLFHRMGFGRRILTPAEK
ncbi:MAG: cytochrome b/b6 domain-containing protein [Burkholderiales bacterium]|nr:cytochrome b/b6 domain-containing protein [Burkholderiales bacterium]